MVEMLVATSVFSIVFGIAAMLYVHASWRTANALESNRLMGQVRDLSKYLDNTIRNSNYCQIVTRGLPLLGTTALECTMPANGATTDQYGTYSSYTASSCANGQVHWGTGVNRWFYFADTTGNYANNGNYRWIAEKASGTPAQNGIANFTFYNGNTNTYNWSLISSVTFSVNTANDTVTYTITASDMFANGATLGTSTDTADSRSLTLTRTVYWQHSVT